MELKASELRLGNFVISPGRGPVSMNAFRMKCMLDAILNNEEVSYKPIPLTEEWLVGFLFEYDAETNKWSLLKSLDRFDYLFELEFLDEEAYVTLNNVEWNYKYVHQLQNLYFALTNTNLKLE